MSTLSCRGYLATVQFDSEDMILTGRIAGINDVIGFHAETPAELLAAFHEAVDDNLETCAKLGKPPEKAYSGKASPQTLRHLRFAATAANDFGHGQRNAQQRAFEFVDKFGKIVEHDRFGVAGKLNLEAIIDQPLQHYSAATAIALL